METFEGGRYEEAAEGFKKIMEVHPLTPLAVEAELMLADTYYSSGRYEEASVYYGNFSTLRPAHPKAPYALFQKGFSYFRTLPTIDRDQTPTRKALFAFADLLAAYPDSPYAERAGELVSFLRGKLAQSELYVGRFYFKTKNFKGALMRFGKVLSDYRDTPLVDEALYYIGASYAQLGEEEKSRDAFSTLLSEFPDSPFSVSASENGIKPLTR
jgi:outer membrane protein assembly factor BamD